jgi:hypothetical protein
VIDTRLQAAITRGSATCALLRANRDRFENELSEAIIADRAAGAQAAAECRADTGKHERAHQIKEAQRRARANGDLLRTAEAALHALTLRSKKTQPKKSRRRSFAAGAENRQ